MSPEAWVALGLGAVPGLYAWWSGYRLKRLLGDPTYPEAHAGRLRWLSGLFLPAFGLALLIAPDVWTGLGAALLAFLLTPMGSFPLRKAALGEAWGPGGYLLHLGRLLLTFGAVWLVVLLAPAILQAIGWALAPATAALALGVAAWSLAGSRLVPFFLRARPLERSDLEEAFEPVFETAACPRPRLLVAPWGGRVMNAYALPAAFGQPAVIFTEALVRDLEPAESTAICAHEVAHLETYAPRRIRGLAVRMGALIVLAGGAVAGFDYADAGMEVLHPIWGLGVLLGVSLALAAHQKKEEAADLRALEIGADPESLISALTKLHQRLHLPRHLPEWEERGASHPTLARRSQAIRRAAGLEVSEIEPLLVRAESKSPRRGGAGRAVLLGADRLIWFEQLPADPGDPSSEAAAHESPDGEPLLYEEVRSIRLHRGWRGTILRLTPVSGKTRRFPVAAADVPAVKAQIEQVDHRLGGDPVRESALWISTGHPIVRLAGILGAIVGLLPLAPWALFFACLSLVLRPARTSLAAAATAALGSFGLVASRPVLVPAPGPWTDLIPITVAVQLLLAVLLTACFLGALKASPVSDPEGEGRSLRLTQGLLAVPAGCSLAWFFFSLVNGLPAGGRHLLLIVAPSLPISLLALAAAHLASRRSRARRSVG